jgi:LuxR family maltose regulon positive regulatory protein
VTDVIARMQAWDMPTDRIFAYLALIHIQQSQADFSGAFQTLRTAKDLKAANPVLAQLAHAVDACEIRLYLATADISAAGRLIEDLRPGVSHMVFLQEQELILQARVCLAQGQVDEALNFLDPLVRGEAAAGRLSVWLEGLVLQACALDRQGSRKAAVDVLVKALTLAEPEGFARVFLDEGEALRVLLVAAHKLADQAVARPAKAYISRLLEAFPAGASHPVAPVSPAETERLVEPLTVRETEVLLLVAAGDSNRTIAKKLVITISAVKKHTGNLFGKLNVNSRTQAVARARALGLLPVD